jgi:AI-2 transport protein TqsA
VSAVAGIGQNFDAYQKEFDQMMEHVAGSVPLERLGIRPDPQTGWFPLLSADTGRRLLGSLLSGITDVVSNGALVIVFTIFIVLGHDGRRRAAGLLAEIEARVKQYLIQMVGFAAATGLLVGLTLGLLGVEFSFVFGFLAFLLSFIPTIGGVIATLLPLPAIMLSPELSVTHKVLAVALPAAIQIVIGSFLQPKVQGGSLDLHPVAVLMALVFFGMIWGIVGAFLATPITGVIKIVIERIPATRPMGDLMAGKLDVLAEPAVRKEEKTSRPEERLTEGPDRPGGLSPQG